MPISRLQRITPAHVLALAGLLLLLNLALLLTGAGAPPAEDASATPVEAVEEFDADAEVALHERRAQLSADSASPPDPEPEPAGEEPASAPEPEPEPRDDRVPLEPAPPNLAAFAGLSTWIDVYDIEWTPEEQVARAAAGGVELLYLQSGKFDSPGDIHHPDRYGRTIELAHDAGMKVMVWYVPDFVDYERDLRRVKTAVAYTTERGDRPDAFGLDIETEDQTDVAERNRQLLQMSADLREWVGPLYPLAAVVVPPLQLDLRPGWWPDFPWRELTEYYDVWVPMSYSSFRGTDAGTTYRWTVGNVRELRERAGDPDLPIHLAGGIADNLPEVEVFLESVRDARVHGAGLYDLHTTQPEDWPALQRLRAGD